MQQRRAPGRAIASTRREHRGPEFSHDGQRCLALPGSASRPVWKRRIALSIRVDHWPWRPKLFRQLWEIFGKTRHLKVWFRQLSRLSAAVGAGFFEREGKLCACDDRNQEKKYCGLLRAVLVCRVAAPRREHDDDCDNRERGWEPIRILQPGISENVGHDLSSLPRVTERRDLATTSRRADTIAVRH
jgi:hypothetical protein